MKELKICAVCKYNEDIVKQLPVDCNSHCTKYKNRAYTIWKKKQDSINPVTGKPVSECNCNNSWGYYSNPCYPCPVSTQPPEFKLCSEINKGDCRYFKKTDKKPYLGLPVCINCGSATEWYYHWSYDEIFSVKCTHCRLVTEYDSLTMTKILGLNFDSMNCCYSEDRENKDDRREKELKIKYGLIPKPKPKPKTVKKVIAVKKKKHRWRR